MGDLISRSALIKAMKNKYEVADKTGLNAVGLDCGFIITEKIIDEQPSVDPVPVEEIKNLENPYSKFIECYKCEFDGFETARRHLLLKYEEKVQE